MGRRRGPDGAASPWHIAYAERFIGSVRRECLAHVIVLSAAERRKI
jgi:hypothetical protein